MRFVVVWLAGWCCAFAWGQVVPDERYPILRPEFVAFVCPEREQPTPQNDAERARFAMRERYRALLPAYLARVPEAVDVAWIAPVDGVRVADVADTWGAPRSGGRRHEGQDLFAPRGTTIRAATAGFVYRIDDLSLGGLSVTILGGGGVRTFYTHLDAVALSLREGEWVEVGTPLGFVGNSGNAASTPPHLHLGIYQGAEDDPCAWRAIDPLPLLVDRP
jgi:murein DD-endopeptidase MepM/ murein hydrolase activator NlpD